MSTRPLTTPEPRKKKARTGGNGRNHCSTFLDSFSKSLKVSVVCSSAFRSLSSSAKSVCFIAYAKNDNSRYHKRRNERGLPVFEFTQSEGKELLGISTVTFSKAINELQEHGFIDYERRGNFRAAYGIANLFALSQRWRDWKAPSTGYSNHKNLEKARAKRNEKKKQDAKDNKRSLRVVAPEGWHVGQQIYFHTPESVRARRGKIIEITTGEHCQVQGCRQAGKFTPSVYTVSTTALRTVEDQRKITGKSRARA